MTDGADGGERTMPVPTSPRRGHLVTWGGNGIEGCLEKEGLLHLDALTRLLGDDASRGGSDHSPISAGIRFTDQHAISRKSPIEKRYRELTEQP
jgi:hypothetical protein